VNPVGRQGLELELENQQRLMLEGGYAEDVHNGEYEQPKQVEQAPQREEGGIFSSSTLAALQGAKVVSPQSSSRRPAGGPLVDYGSDDSDGDW
jgi:hypothetical protein